MEIPLDEITILPDRQRKEFKTSSIESLADSIADKGLFHAPVVNRSDLTLVAGERRLRAIRLLNEREVSFSYHGSVVPQGSVPITYLDNLSPYALQEAELEENILREDLTPVEEAQAIARLHELRKEQREEVGEKQTLKDTVAELLETRNSPIAEKTISDSIIVSKHADDEDVKNASSLREAMKIIRKKEDEKVREERTKNLDLSATRHNLFHGDCRVFLENVPNDEFDIVLTDPPYGVSADEFGDMADATHEYSDSPAHFWSLMNEVIPELSRTLKPSSHVFLFHDLRWFSDLKERFENEGFTVHSQPLIWDKGASVGMLPRPEHGPRNTYECVLFAFRGDRRTNGVFPICRFSPRYLSPSLWS